MCVWLTGSVMELWQYIEFWKPIVEARTNLESKIIVKNTKTLSDLQYIHKILIYAQRFYVINIRLRGTCQRDS